MIKPTLGNLIHGFTAEQSDKIADAYWRSKTTIRLTVVRDCVFCGAVRAMTQDAEVATGRPILHDMAGTGLEPWTYQPEVGEILSNHLMECGTCHDWQAS